MYHKVVVIGGGASGLAAATHLFRSGVKDLKVFEARKSLGGRIHTEKHRDHCIEYGAQWIHGEDDNVLFDIAKENGMIDDTSSRDLSEDSIFVREDGKIVSKEIASEFELCMCNLNEDSNNDFLTYKGSVGQYYTERFSGLNRWGDLGFELLEWLGRFSASIDGSNTWFDLSAYGQTKYKECPGHQLTNWKSGYASLINLYTELLPSSVLQVDTPVRSIFWNGDTENKHAEESCDSGVAVIKEKSEDEPDVTIELASGDIIYCNHVIVTCSLAVLKSDQKEMFKPALPDKKVKAIDNIGIDVVNKIYLEFAYEWWPEEVSGFNLLHSKNTRFDVCTSTTWQKKIFGFYRVHKLPNILCGWITGEAAKEMEKLSLAEVTETCVALLRSYLGSHFNISEPVWSSRSTWYTDPHIRGSYSYRSLESEEKQVWQSDLAEPLLNRKGSPVVCFAGEATHDYYYSTVHGAIETGNREAERLLNYMSNVNKQSGKDVILGNVSSYSKLLGVGLKENLSCDVIVVGAGMAGLGAARELQASGIDNFQVLEALDRIGGRVHTISTSSGTKLDLGAQWIHGQVGNSIYYLIENMNMLSGSSLDGEGEFCTDEGVRIPRLLVKETIELMESVINSIGDFFTHIKSNERLFTNCWRQNFSSTHSCESQDRKCYEAVSPSLSVGEILAKEFEKHLEAGKYSDYEKALKRGIFEWTMLWFIVDNACDSMDALSARRWGEFYICRGEDNVNPVGGMVSVVNRAAESIEKNIKLNKMVKAIDYERALSCKNGRFLRSDGSRPVQVTCDDGSVYQCDHVIVTSSLGFLKANLNMFKPPLPATLLKAIRDLGYGTMNKIFLEFPYRWWDRNSYGYQFVWTETSKEDFASKVPSGSKEWYKDVSGFEILKGRENYLYGWVGGASAVEMEHDSLDDVKSVCYELLRKFSGVSSIPEPIAVYRSKWFCDPLFMGTYSNRLTSAEETSPEELNIPIYSNRNSTGVEIPLLALAGEANSQNFFSTIHGAFENGMQQARHYIQFRKASLAQSGKISSKL